MISSPTIFGLLGLLAPLLLLSLILLLARRRRNAQRPHAVPTHALDLIPLVRLFAAGDFLLLADRPALRRRLRRNRNRVARLYLRDLENRCRDLRRVAPAMAPVHTEALWLEMLKLGLLLKLLRAQLLLGGGPLPGAICRSVAGTVSVLEHAYDIKRPLDSPKVIDNWS